MELTDDDIQRKCAEADGWRICADAPWLGFTDANPFRRSLPDYPADLNACASLRKLLSEEERKTFIAALLVEVGFTHTQIAEASPDELVYSVLWTGIDATARQICVAFLKAKGAL